MAINAKLQTLINIKNNIGTAITNKGGIISNVNNISNMAFINNTAAYSGDINAVTTNNGFIYVGGYGNSFGAGNIQKFYESNLAFVGNSTSYGGAIFSITINNGFIYVGGTTNQTVQKFNESTLAFVGNTVTYGGQINQLVTNNGFIYVGGAPNLTVKKFYEDNLAFVGNTAAYGGDIQSIAINNGFIYAGGAANQTVQKFYEDNLAFVGNTANYGGSIRSITTNNGFIYVGGFTNLTVQKFYEDNLAFVGNTASYGGPVQSVITNNGFIYAGGSTNQRVQKFYESNLAFVGNTAAYGGSILSITTNNGFIYAGGLTNRTVQKFQETQSSTPFLNYATEIDNISTGPSSYSGWAVQSENNSIYTIHNGFDALNNPSPSLSNLVFNQWVLNNSTTNPIVLTNVVLSSPISFLGVGTTINEANFPIQQNTFTAFAASYPVIKPPFIYLGRQSDVSSTVGRYHLSNFAFINNGTTFGIGQFITAFADFNGNFYVASASQNIARTSSSDFSTLAMSTFVTAANYGTNPYALAFNNGFIYIGGTRGEVRKYHEGNAVLSGQTPSYGGEVRSIVVDNGVLYVAGRNGTSDATAQNSVIKTYNENNLSFISQSPNVFFNASGGAMRKIIIDNNLIYAVGVGRPGFAVYNKTTLNLVAESSSYLPAGQNTQDIIINRGYIYTAGSSNATRGFSKIRQNDLTFIAHSVPVDNGAFINGINFSGGNMYVFSNGRTLRLNDYQITSFNNQSYFTITNAKEDI